MIRTFLTLLTTTLILFATPAAAQRGLTYEQQVFDFGHVGIDFNVFHTYTYINRTDQTVTISDVVVSCDCSTVQLIDSLVEPGDTAFFKLTFNTRDYYGPTNKSFTATTTDPENPELKYYYLATVGQWHHGLQPEPFSLFFLPGKKQATVSVPNRKFDEIRLTEVIAHDATFDVKVLEKSADKSKAVKLEVSPSEGLGKSTFLSSLTFIVEADGLDKPTILTIPIKIVRY